MGGNQLVTESQAHKWVQAGLDRHRLLSQRRRRRRRSFNICLTRNGGQLYPINKQTNKQPSNSTIYQSSGEMRELGIAFMVLDAIEISQQLGCATRNQYRPASLHLVHQRCYVVKTYRGTNVDSDYFLVIVKLRQKFSAVNNEINEVRSVEMC